MIKLTKNELIEIEGGFNITGTLLNSITKGVSVIMDIGRSLGSSIRRIMSGNLCDF